MNKLIISKFYNDIPLGFLYIDDSIERVFDFSDSFVDCIYAGIVKDVQKNLSSAFVEFGNGLKGYYPFQTKDDASLRQGDKVMVQVKNEKIKSKDYLLTSNIQLKSDCLILTSNNSSISVSRKITNSDDREFLKGIFDDLDCLGAGFIIRTNALDYDVLEIKKQAKGLLEEYDEICSKFKYASPKSIIYESNYLINSCKTLKNTKIITDDNVIFDKLKDEDLDVVLYNELGVSIVNNYKLGKVIKELTERIVWLKSGANLVVEGTESLTSIDVNSGKNVSKTDREENIKNINKEAAIGVLKTLRLRNISGIIIVDFINMDSESSDEIFKLMVEEAKKDYVQCNIVGFTKLGLLEITRKKYRKPMLEVLGKNNE